MRKLLFITLLMPLFINGQTISDVTSRQNGSMIDVSYKLSGLSSNQSVTINLYYSLNDGGYSSSLQKVTGDIGKLIAGNGLKTITWDLISEIGSLDGNTKFKVEVLPNNDIVFPKAEGVTYDIQIDKIVLNGTTLTIYTTETFKKTGTYNYNASNNFLFAPDGKKYTASTISYNNIADDYFNIELMSGAKFKVNYIYKDVNPSITTIDAMKLDGFEFRNLSFIKE